MHKNLHFIWEISLFSLVFHFIYIKLLFLSNFDESAKLRALRAKNVLTCQRALRAYVLTCQHVLRAHVLTWQPALHAYVFTCQRALRAYVITCQRTSFIATIFSFTAIIVEVVHTVGKV